MKHKQEIRVYNKLVRDRIPKKIRKNGGKCKVKILSQDGLKNILPTKLNEEVDELKTALTREDRLLEAADVIQVITDMLWAHNLSLHDFYTERKNLRATPVPHSLTELTTDMSQLAHELEECCESTESLLTNLVTISRHISALLEVENWSTKELNNKVGERLQSVGGFRKGYFLIWATAT